MREQRILAPKKIEYAGQYVLRPVEPSDIPQIELARNASLADLQVYMDWAHIPFERSRFLDRILTQLSAYLKGDEYEMAFFDKKTGAFLVHTGFYPTVSMNPLCFEIGYWTSSEWAGKGFATLATQIQIALIFEYFKGDRIEITSNIENKASLHVIEKCGFHYEGELRHFFARGNEEMFSKGYTRERRAFIYSLIPEDITELAWYSDIVSQITLFPFLGDPIPLTSCVIK